MKKISDLHKKWMQDEDYSLEYEALSSEFALASAVIAARARAGLTQVQLARKLKTSQSAIARLESGSALPSTRTLKKLAVATGSRLTISLEPARSGTARKSRRAVTSP